MTDWHQEVFEEMGWPADEDGVYKDGVRIGDVLEVGVNDNGTRYYRIARYDNASGAQQLEMAEVTTPEPETDEVAQARALAFKEKLASIQFPGRGKANRSRQIASHGKAVSDADREHRGKS